MSAALDSQAGDRLLAVADGDDLDVLVGERQLDDALNGDAVVGEEQLVRHGASTFGSQCATRRLAPGRSRLMKSMISCIGVPGRKMPLTPIALQLRDVHVRNDAADHDQHVVQPLLAQQFHQPRAM